MSTAIPTRIEKCKGAMLATAIGDALGWPNEQRSKNTTKSLKNNDLFVEWTRRCSGSHWYYEKILAGEYSDDTQMTLSVARSLIAGNWEEILTKKELPFWLEYERGGGRAVLKAANACKKGLPIWKTTYPRDYFNAGGNGAVMRILPHIISMASKENIHMLMIDVIRNAIITHGHPRAILGATCYAYALNYLLHKKTVLEYGELVSVVIEGQSVWGTFPNTDTFGFWLEVATQHKDYNYADQWNNDLMRMRDQLEYIKRALEKGLMLDDYTVLAQLECFSKSNGAGDVAILASLYLASRYANNPILGIKVPAFSVGADTDTIASITGGLLGMLCGTNWIPIEWHTVQDYGCLLQVVELLFSEKSNEVAKIVTTAAKAQNEGWVNTPIGQMRQIDQITIKSGKFSTITIKKWISALGQTLYIKHSQKNEENHYSEQQIKMALDSVNSKSEQSGKSAAQQVTVANSMPNSNAQVREQKQVCLDNVAIETLLANPKFKKNVTIGKILKAMHCLIDSNDSSKEIAKQLKVDLDIIELLRSYVR